MRACYQVFQSRRKIGGRDVTAPAAPSCAWGGEREVGPSAVYVGVHLCCPFRLHRASWQEKCASFPISQSSDVRDGLRVPPPGTGDISDKEFRSVVRPANEEHSEYATRLNTTRSSCSHLPRLEFRHCVRLPRNNGAITAEREAASLSTYPCPRLPVDQSRTNF